MLPTIVCLLHRYAVVTTACRGTVHGCLSSQWPLYALAWLLVLPVTLALPTARAGAQNQTAPERQVSPARRSGAFQYPPQISGASEHVYRQVGDVALKLWVFTPATTSTSAAAPATADSVNGRANTTPHDGYPAVVFFFGGGWTSGSPEQFVPHCRYLQSRGMVAITCDYRVASRHEVQAAACVADAQQAIRWVRQHAGELQINPARICAAGGSAGGHLAACTALLPKSPASLDTPTADGPTDNHPAATAGPAASCVPNALALFNPVVALAPWPELDSSEAAIRRLAALATRLGAPAESLSPLHQIQPGAPPTIIFHGDADTTVPLSTVTAFTRAMQSAGNRCELCIYRGAEHGFFNLRGPDSSVGQRQAAVDNQIQWFRRTTLRLDQFLGSLGWIDQRPTLTVVDQDHVRLRGSLTNSAARFLRDRAGHVAFLGGSITEMEGYRPRVEAWLTAQFPQTQFQFTNAGIASTCSHTGAFRLQRDVLSQGPVDLLFVEFAVNDDQDAQHTAEGCLQGMEGIIRRVRQHNPAADIVMIHFVNPEMLSSVQEGREPLSSAQHELVARYYGVSSIDLPHEVADRISAGQLTWEQYGGTHPGPIGNQLTADLAAALLTAAWRSAGTLPEKVLSGTTGVQPHPAPEQPLLATAFDAGDWLPHSAVQPLHGWTVGIPDWNTVTGTCRARFQRAEVLQADQPGAALQVSFRGRAIGAYVLAGPDAGQLEYRVDGGVWKTAELFHQHSRQLHYPRTLMLESVLPAGAHQLEVRVGAGQHPDSTGHAARIVSLVVNH